MTRHRTFVRAAAASAGVLVPQIQTTNDGDIPQAAPIEVSLAGSPRPDVSRFLSVRTAIAPSISPDGARVAYRTTTTGSPQVWVADAAGSAPEQLTYGAAVTFHEWLWASIQCRGLRSSTARCRSS
jgi:hypothetical protein